MTTNAKSNHAEDLVLNALLRNTTGSLPSSVFLGLHTGSPAEDNSTMEDAGSDNEVDLTNLGASGSTTRPAITFAAPTSVTNGPSGGRSCFNSSAIELTAKTSGAGFGTVSHFGIYDNATVASGNLIYYGALGTSKTIAAGDTIRFAASAIEVSEL
tara:strand:- start:78 stop:545 length:468 start_codon:yes stop_codon:yes gene_type:complete